MLQACIELRSVFFAEATSSVLPVVRVPPVPQVPPAPPSDLPSLRVSYLIKDGDGSNDK